MKKQYKLIIPLLGLLLASCTDFLQKDMDGIYNSDNFFKTAGHAEIALTGAYNSLMFNSNQNCIWVFGDIASDDAVKGGLAGDQSDIEFIEKFQVIPSNGYVEMLWQHHYEGIARTNNVITKTPPIEMDEQRKAEIIGEAKFLRAYFYFQLVNVYGDIPLKVRPADTPEAIHTPLSKVEEIYAQIEKDLVEAMEVLPATALSQDLGRATKGAAAALLSKAMLYNKQWDDAIKYAQVVQELGYELVDVYSDNFKVDGQNNQESVFEVQHLSAASPMLGNILNQWFATRAYNGYGFNAPTQNFVDEFEVTDDGVVDPRLDYTVGREGKEWVNGEPFDPSWSPTGFLSKKMIQPLEEIPMGTKQDADINYVSIRLAEVLLIKAEALNEKGQTVEAIELVNKIRKRSRESYLYDESLEGFGTIPQNLLPDVESASQSSARDIIRHEKRVELGFEFHRFFDLMHYGKAVAEEALSENGFNYDDHRYFPIPQSERDSNSSIQ